MVRYIIIRIKKISTEKSKKGNFSFQKKNLLKPLHKSHCRDKQILSTGKI